MAFYGMMDSGPSPIDQYIGRYMQNQEARKQQERQLSQQQSQFDTAFGETKRVNDANISNADATQKLNQYVQRIKQFQEIELPRAQAAGRAGEAIAAFKQEVQSIPGLQYAVGKLIDASTAPNDMDAAQANTSKYAKTQTGLAASGSEDAQARSFTSGMAGQPLQAPQFANAEARELRDPSLTGGEYGKSVRVGAELAPTANQTSANQTQLTMNREDNAALDKRNEADIASREKIATTRIDGKPSTAVEKRALGFYQRAKDAIDQLEGVYGDTGKPLHEVVGNKSTAGQAFQRYAPNVVQPEENQLYTQAQRQFTEARLRKDSGAAIPEHEYENDRKTYFAQPGDSPVVIARKKQARDGLLNALKMESGRAYGEYYGDGGEDIATGNRALDEATAHKFLLEAGGDKAKARQLATAAGYTY
jgi:hypothetical protein